MGAVAAIGGLVLAGVGTAMQVKAAKDQAEAQEEAQAQQGAAAAHRRIAERRAAFRRRRLAEAHIVQGAATSGVSGSSGEAGAISSSRTQGAVEQGGINAQESFERGISKANQKAADAQLQGSIFGELSGLGGNIFQMNR